MSFCSSQSEASAVQTHNSDVTLQQDDEDDIDDEDEEDEDDEDEWTWSSTGDLTKRYNRSCQNPSNRRLPSSTPSDKALRKYEHKINLGNNTHCNTHCNTQ
uniref:Uncharacterized protein n=1 Tax=Acanthochromis polyacanthus TaxID=80966 RepID=A0A3Q1F0N1_9TELE